MCARAKGDNLKMKQHLSERKCQGRWECVLCIDFFCIYQMFHTKPTNDPVRLYSLLSPHFPATTINGNRATDYRTTKNTVDPR